MHRRVVPLLIGLLVSVVVATTGVACSSGESGGSAAGTPTAVATTAGAASLDQIQALLDASDFEGAKGQLVVLLEQDDTNAEAHFKLGLAYFNLSDYPAAQEQFERSLELDPTRAPAVHHNLGVLAYQTGDLDTALAEFQSALEADPNDADTHYQLGATYLVLAYPLDAAQPDADLVAKAQAEFERALEISPGKPEALVGQANGYMLLNDYEQAISLLEQALETNPDMREALFALGNAYAATGQTEKSVSTFEHFLETDPPAMWAQQAQEIVSQLTGQ